MHHPKIAEILATQDGVISRNQALACGVSDEQICRRIDQNEWRRLFDGVYFSTSHRMSHEARLRGAVLASGLGAVAWGASAAWWHGLIDAPPARPQVTVPLKRRVRRVQQFTIRRRNLESSDTAVVRTLTVTALPLTVLDAALLPGGSILMDQALQTRLSLADLNEAHERNGRRAGCAEVQRLLLAAADGSRSAAEKLLHRILRKAQMVGWSGQLAVNGVALDAGFVRERVGIEVDGWRFHADAKRNSNDLARQNALVNAGWHILRYDWHRLSNDPDGVVSEIRAALAFRVGKVS